MPTSITPPSAWPSSRDCSRPTATVSASSRSPIGAIRRPSPRSANRAWASSSRLATWTRWSTTSRSRRSAAARTRIRPAARPVCAPITPASSTETSSAARTRRRPSSSAASRRACVAWRTTITGRTPSSAPSCSTRAPTSSPTAWASDPSSRLRTPWPAVSPSMT